MSQYISSFLIDPVVRQARRFSRPNTESPHPTNLRPSFTSNEESPFLHIESPAAAAAAAAQVEPPHVNLSTDVNRSTTLTGLPEVASPTSADDREQHPWPRDEQPNSTAFRSVDTDSLEPSANPVSYTLAAADDVSNLLLHRIPDRLRSTTSSFSNSSRSLLDANMSPADGPDQPSRTNTRDTGDSASSGVGDGSLPEDDGMGPMRKRIIAIQRTQSSNEEKARLVHGLMTEKHNSSQQSLHGPHFPRAYSIGSRHSSDRPWTPSSPKSTESSRQTQSPPTSSFSNGEESNPFQLSPDDLKPTYHRKPLPAFKDGDQEGSSMEIEEVTNSLGCEHYKRNIKLQCSACNRWYTCRFCHDAVEDHMLNRRETKNMLCMLCGCAQPASEECALCSVRGAWYYCDVCKLWDDDSEKSIYHCNDCGICRVGKGLGKDFFHCKVSDLNQSKAFLY